MTDKKLMPWEVLPSVWKTEAAFWSWVKGAIRKSWVRHPIKLEYIKRKRVKVANPNFGKRKGSKEEVWGCKCEQCEQYFIQSETEVNHKGASASLKQLSDIQACVEKLLVVSFDDLEILCKPCHEVYSYMQSHNISREEAVLEKKVIEFKKYKVQDQKEILTQKLGKSKMATLTNADKRIEAYRSFLKGEHSD